MRGRGTVSWKANCGAEVVKRVKAGAQKKTAAGLRATVGNACEQETIGGKFEKVKGSESS